MSKKLIPPESDDISPDPEAEGVALQETAPDPEPDAANPSPVRPADLPNVEDAPEPKAHPPLVEAIVDAVVEQCDGHGVVVLAPLREALAQAVEYELTRRPAKL